MERRPIKTRSRQWAQWLGRTLVRTGLTPNQMSLLGIVAALAAAWLLVRGAATREWFYFVGAAVGIQLRLLCNMLDGLMAVEGGRPSKTGDLFNDLPDRFEDAAILIGAGYATVLPALGWAATVGALLTAYARVLGGAVGVRQDFRGPMAKPHRMFVMTLACLGAALEAGFDWPARALVIGLGVVAAGTVITAARRAARLIKAMETR